MIKFRQKDFALPALLAPLFTANGLLASATIGGTAISAVQGSKAAKAAEEQHEQMLAAQKRENTKLTKALNNLAEQAKNNPQSASSMIFLSPLSALRIRTRAGPREIAFYQRRNSL